MYKLWYEYFNNQIENVLLVYVYYKGALITLW